MTNINLWTYGVFDIIDTRLFFVPYGLNKLCIYDLRSKLVVDFVDLPDAINNRVSSVSVKAWGIFIVVIPAYSQWICVYDTLTGKLSSYSSINPNNSVIPRGERYLHGYIWENRLYLTPLYDCGIICLERIDNDVVVSRPFENHLKDVINCAVVGDSVFFSDMTDVITQFDLITHNRKEYYKDMNGLKIQALCVGGDNLFFSDVNGHLYCVCMSNRENNSREDVFDCRVQISNFLHIDDCLYLFPTKGDSIIKYDLKNKNDQIIVMHPQTKTNTWNGASFSFSKNMDGVIYVMNTAYECLCIYDTRTGRIDYDYVMLPQKCYCFVEDIFKREYKSSVLIEGEYPFASLDNWIDACVN